MNWKLTLPCTRQEAEAMNEDYEWMATLDPMPTIVADELEAFNDAKWQLQAYFSDKPGRDIISAIRARAPSSAAAEPVLEKLPDEDWLVMSQQGLQPVHAGRFYVHTSANLAAANLDTLPIDAVPFLIEASQAFGTGGHETTSGCLAMLDSMKRSGMVFRYVADIGTGTGLLAFAAQHLWPKAYVTASDIDPVSIDVTAENARINNIDLGQGQGQLAVCVATGTDHEMIRRRAPYDLVIANILAGPLVELAPSFAQIIADGGTLILAGLLNTQASDVSRAYRAQGFRVAQSSASGDWPCLRLVKRQKYSWTRPVRASRRTSQPPGDFGTW